MSAEAAAKVLTYTATLLAVGTCTIRWWVPLRIRHYPLQQIRDNSPLLFVRLDRALAGTGLAASTLLVVSLLIRVWAHTYSAFGWSESLAWDRMRLMAFESRWGSGWRMQMLAALVLTVTFVAIEIRGRVSTQAAPAHAHQRIGAGWALATVSAFAFAYVLPLVGHGAGTAVRVLLHGTHIVGGSVWLGSLAVLIIANRWLHSELHQVVAHRLLGDFWMIATGGVGLMLAGGVAMAVIYVQSWSKLWSTAYGQVLIVKLALVGAIAFCGAANWKRYREEPRADAHDPGHRVATTEVLLALAVVVVTSVLTELEHP